ncbi:MAG: alanine--tRNA ligase, partial [Candidatus Doudnabacteria bacterium]|nr:alanine--tRNA ligase [Candidatus Doudnabacteria bacterium]
MKAAELRKKYLDFFARHGHAIVPSASLVPENDATTLFTGSGMQPMVPYLLGAPHPEGTRITDSQKSFRSQDIEEVGDNRHTTFFEMLGNWSLGDYFKQEQISWMFEFLTRELGLDPNRIYVTCFRGNDNLNIPRDTESAELWQKLFSEKGISAEIVDFPERDGMQGGRIFYYDEKKNWWSRAGVPQNMPVGEPGGPDTEMFWDFGEQLHLHEHSEWKDEPCHVNCDCGRFMEIGNNVFMEYIKAEDVFEKLKQQNVDFGGGLERMLAAVGNDPDMFKIDLLWVLIEYIQQVTGRTYGESTEVTKQMRIVADHIRGSVFLVSDGVVPSNKDRGYVLRRLLRRAMVAVRMLGSTADWVPNAVAAVILTYKDSYPELGVKAAEITKV